MDRYGAVTNIVTLCILAIITKNVHAHIGLALARQIGVKWSNLNLNTCCGWCICMCICTCSSHACAMATLIGIPKHDVHVRTLHLDCTSWLTCLALIHSAIIYMYIIVAIERLVTYWDKSITSHGAYVRISANTWELQLEDKYVIPQIHVHYTCTSNNKQWCT